MKKTLIPSLIWTLSFFSSCGRDDHQEKNSSRKLKSLRKEDANLTNPDLEFNKLNATQDASYIVMFKTDERKTGFKTYQAEYQRYFSLLAGDYFGDPRIKDLRFITEADLTPTTKNTQTFSNFELPLSLQSAPPNEKNVGSLMRVDFASELTAQSFLNETYASGKIWFAEPNFSSELSDDPIFDTYKKNYASVNAQWQNAIKLKEAFDYISTLTAGKDRPTDDDIIKNPPIIAVMDTGLDYEHPDIKNNVWVNTHVGVAGCPNDLHGCNTVNPERGELGKGDTYPCNTTGPGLPLASPDDKCGHGTHVSGIIAAKAGGTYGGVCPFCQIMTIKVVDVKDNDKGEKTPRVLDSAILLGIKYLNRFRSNGSSAVRVINSSFGKYSKSRSIGILMDALRRDGKGVVLIGAAGNEDSMTRSYPAAFPQAVAVGALDDQGRKATFSNYGPWVDISAPGFKIISTIPGNSSAEKSGTSMACPIVAGSLGLYLGIKPNSSADELINLLTKTADGSVYSEDFAGGYNFRNYFPKIAGEDFRRPLLGTGRLDVSLLVQGKEGKGFVAAPSDRVTPGCGMIAGGISTSPKEFLLILLFPFILLGFFRFSRKK